MGTDLFTQLGCDLAAKKIIVVKSSQHFHAVVLEGRQARDLRRRAWRGDARPQHPALPQDPPAEVAAAPERRAHRSTRAAPPSDGNPHETTRTFAHLAAASRARCSASLPRPPRRRRRRCSFVAHADVKILDPTFTTAYITRNFGYMVYDMLFGLDEKGRRSRRWSTATRPRRTASCWTFTLRPGLKFTDGNAGHAGRLRRLAAALEQQGHDRPGDDRAPAPSGRRSTRAPSR